MGHVTEFKATIPRASRSDDNKNFILSKGLCFEVSRLAYIKTLSAGSHRVCSHHEWQIYHDTKDVCLWADGSQPIYSGMGSGLGNFVVLILPSVRDYSDSHYFHRILVMKHIQKKKKKFTHTHTHPT